MATDDARNRILQAAGEVFAEKGFKDATVRDICGKAEVNLASVNYYFGDKERLYVETVRRAHPGSPQAGEEHPWPEGVPPAVKLKFFIRGMLERLIETETEAWKIRLMQREILNPTPACREMMQEYFRSRFGQLQEILAEILPEETPELARHQIGFSIVGQCVYFRAACSVIQMVVGEDEHLAHYGVEPLAEHISQFCLASLGLAPPLAKPDGIEAK